MATDWKDALAGLLNNAECTHTDNAECTGDTNTSEEPGKVKRQKINVSLEKKGRGGKTATILYGFDCSDEELQQIGSYLRKAIGTGGSARGGEILLQGDWRGKVAEVLAKKYPRYFF